MKLYPYFLSVFLFLSSCEREQENIFEKSSAQRIQEHISELKNTLVSSAGGWRMSYFPNIDKNKFADIDYNLYNHEAALLTLAKETGYGGYNFWIKFSQDGKAEMQSDYSTETQATTMVSDYKVGHVSGIQLSFVTQNYIHFLVGPEFRGSSDFIYSHTDDGGRLIFKTTTHSTEGSEYIVLEKVENQSDWQSQMSNIIIQKNLLERMEKPMLTIKNAEGEVVFKSNYYRSGFFDAGKRYCLFIKDHVPESFNPVYFSGVGSGFNYTETGIFFNNGLKLNDETIFKNFQNHNGTFVSEANGYTAEISK